ncbi:MAG: nitrilase-related carbon-nitrogen hydrolase, partial [Pseudomonadota bacterium]
LDENLKKMESFLVKAQREGARLAVFPEMAYFTSKREGLEKVISKYWELSDLFQSWARKYSMALIPGTVREPNSQNSDRFFNTLLFLGPDGKILAKYQKIFRFQANLPHHTYDEGRFCEAGNKIITCKFEDWDFGFAVCFDLRFPELFRSLRKKGARVFILPAAFTVPTGEAHWEILVRARAIENQAYVIAPDLTLVSGEGLSQYGHSLAVDPWGKILASQNTEEGMSLVEISKEKLSFAESQIALWQSRNEGLFPIT